MTDPTPALPEDIREDVGDTKPLYHSNDFVTLRARALKRPIEGKKRYPSSVDALEAIARVERALSEAIRERDAWKTSSDEWQRGAEAAIRERDEAQKFGDEAHIREWKYWSNRMGAYNDELLARIEQLERERDEARAAAAALRSQREDPLRPVLTREDFDALPARDIASAALSTQEAGPEPGCTCGFGGQHDDANPQCDLNRTQEAGLEPELCPHGYRLDEPCGNGFCDRRRHTQECPNDPQGHNTRDGRHCENCGRDLGHTPPEGPSPEKGLA